MGDAIRPKKQSNKLPAVLSYMSGTIHLETYENQRPCVVAHPARPQRRPWFYGLIAIDRVSVISKNCWRYLGGLRITRWQAWHEVSPSMVVVAMMMRMIDDAERWRYGPYRVSSVMGGGSICVHAYRVEIGGQFACPFHFRSIAAGTHRHIYVYYYY
jgi:hypothetical protein